jgi:hypothetical protein
LKNTPQGVNQGGLFLHDNAPVHRALGTKKKLAYQSLQYLCHPPYSQNMAPPDYHLFPRLKKELKCCHCSSYTQVIVAAVIWLDEQNYDAF